MPEVLERFGEFVQSRSVLEQATLIVPERRRTEVLHALFESGWRVTAIDRPLYVFRGECRVVAERKL